MTQQDLILLNNIEEALKTIYTKGQDTIVMGRVLEALHDFVEMKQREVLAAAASISKEE